MPLLKRIQIPFVVFLLLNSFSVFAAAPQVQTYNQLVHAIREARAASQQRIETAVQQEKVREAWETGKLIDEHVLQHKDRADYDKQVFKRLAQDLTMSETELYRMREFFRAYPNFVPAQKLSWSHYQVLLTVNDPAKRKEIMEAAVEKKWNRNRLREEIRKRKLPVSEELPEEKLEAKPGKLNVYRVIRATAGPFQGELALDLGFANYFRPKEIRKFKENNLVILEKGKLKAFQGFGEDRYNYQAYVLQIIDGDTLTAVVDLGFNIVTVQTLRLRGLDAPEIISAEGKEAKAFVESVIASLPGGGQSPILIKTTKSDKYDRYLADIWIGDVYLNQQLLDHHLAVRVSE